MPFFIHSNSPSLFPNPGDSGDSSLVVSLEINSVMYQGVLFAQPKSDKAAPGHFPASSASAAAAAPSSRSSPAVSPTAITTTNALASAAAATEVASQNNGGGAPMDGQQPLSHEART